MKRRYPKHIHGFIDARGRPRFVYRPTGKSLPGLPWSPEFMAAYAEQEQAAKPNNILAQAGADRVVPRSLRALAIEFYNDRSYQHDIKPLSQKFYRNAIDALCKEKGKDGKPHGDRSAVTLQSHHIEKMMEAKADKPDSANYRPDAANNLRKALRAMMKVAKKLGWRTDDPTLGIKKFKPKSKSGFHRWTEAEVATFEAKHPIGSKARLALALGLYTGQARADVVLMGEQHISNEVLDWVRMKTKDSTGYELAIPVHPTLRKIIDATPSGHLTFLVTEIGAPYSASGFGNWFRQRSNEAGLPQCSFHGLRKAAATRLIDAGSNVAETSAITGHASLAQLQVYIEERDRKKAARRAMNKLIEGGKVLVFTVYTYRPGQRCHAVSE